MNSISKHDSEGKSKVICSRIQAEKDILQHMIDSAKNIHLVYLDTNFNFVKVNQAYAQTCGYKPEEMVGKNHFALYPHKENEAIFRKVRDSGDATHFHDKPFVFPDQRERGITYWDWTLEPIKETSGKVRGLVFSLVETTERKKAEKACREAEERLSLAKDAADLGVHEYDVSSGRVIWDDRIRELWGVDPDEPTTYDTFMAGVHPDDRQRLQKLVDEALDPKSGGKYLSEFRSINKRNGETRWIKATGKVFLRTVKLLDLLERQRT